MQRPGFFSRPLPSRCGRVRGGCLRRGRFGAGHRARCDAFAGHASLYAIGRSRSFPVELMTPGD